MLGLGLAGFVQRYVGLALKPTFGVPDRLPVPPEYEPLVLAQRYSPALPATALPATAASGSGITGQSFQMRSSA
jgi:hypothetical protein